MKMSNVVIFFLTVLLVAGLALCFGNFNNQLSFYQRSAAIANQQLHLKEIQASRLSQKVALLSKKLKAAETPPSLAYQIKNGDTLYGLFGNSWQKVAKINKIKDAENLSVGKTIYFPGRLIRVAKGQNFYYLFGKDWKRIAWLNGFCPQQAEILPVGQCLKVPKI